MSELVLFADGEWVATWLTPIWILSLGCIGGLLLLPLVWGIVYLSRTVCATFLPYLRRPIQRPDRTIIEGPMLPIFIIVCVFAAFGVLGSLAVNEPGKMLSSIQKLNSGKEVVYEFKVAPAAEGQDSLETEIDVFFVGEELRQLVLSANEDLVVLPVPTDEEEERPFRFRLDAGKDRVFKVVKGEMNPFIGREVQHLYVINHSDTTADLAVKVTTGTPYPEMKGAVVTAVLIAFIFLLYFTMVVFFPKMSAIAVSTAKSESASPMFLLLAAMGAVALFAFIWIPYYTLGEDIKMVKDSGLTLILVFGIFMAVWAATRSVSEEIEGRTALTILSKPIGRRSFIAGKFFGISWSVLLLFVILGVVFVLCISYKPIFDAKEDSGSAGWSDSYRHVVSVVPGLVLALLETLVLASISVAISTRLPMLANFTITFAIYVLGNLTPQLVQSTEADFEIVRFVALLIATVFPVLDHFNLQAAIAGGAEPPLGYLLASCMYSMIYGAIALLVALIFFEDRDLA